MAYCLICERSRDGQGPRLNKTYVNVAAQSRLIGNLEESLADYLAREPNSPWLDPNFNEFLIEVPEPLYRDIQDGDFILFHDGFSNLPLWQQQNTTTGDALVLGSHSDPENAQTFFTADQPLPDDRFILRIYDKDPVTDGTAVNLVSEDFLEDKTETVVERFVRLFQEDNTPVNRNVIDRIFINNYWLELRWGSSDNISAGVSRLFVTRDQTGNGELSSDAGYQVLGPAGEKSYQWTVYTRALQLRG